MISHLRISMPSLKYFNMNFVSYNLELILRHNLVLKGHKAHQL